jgi:hypothetical protein
MTTDPRLQNVSLLTLAAMRVQHRLASQPPDWQHTEGLCALLEAARQQAVPPRDPWARPPVEACTGLARLLAEARQWQGEGRHGA